MIKNIVLGLLLCFGLDAVAEVVTVRNNDKIEVSMSSMDMNRIAFVNDKIKSAWVMQDMANVIVDEDLGQVRVVLKDESTSFCLSLVTKSGATIDLQIKPTKALGERVLLELDKRSSLELAKARRKKDVQLKALIKRAFKGILIKGYRVLAHEDNSSDRSLKNLIQQKEYIGTKYKLIVYEYRNLKNTTEVISEHLFRMSPNVIAVAIKHKNLKPKATTKVVVVEDIAQQIKQWGR